MPTAKKVPRAATAKPAETPDHAGHRGRLRQRFLESGGAGIPDYEILELLLFAASRRADVKPLAKALLREFDDLAGVLGAEPARLQRIAGCGPSAIAILKAAREAGVRMLRGQVMGRHAIGNWQALLDYCRGALARAPTEEFHVLFLDRKNHLIADERQGRGTVDHTPVYPREVVKRALELQASAIIMVHNHPSGDPTPSHADIDMTRQLRDAAKGVGISLHDHVIVGANGHSSFKSLGLL